ncbi:ABC transporter transmembrane domain-containing protein [Cryptosporangium aurantiacum]|uniref:Fatty acid ABC transporter ATP-binding/permease protein n=1 Tax=Cryptosporangium aurantiacum TaxID=134849 RepID=A0A1M7QXT9_9ACTN|nr:ABC transporter transmembrane domain-containing protein [Cryptosporangium aurantiacum]SHN36847.1 ABC-type multidrug transport system, ATPase and permease component [Cryptosporangium aurantiacum]
MAQLVEVREPGLPARTAVIDGVVEVGRDASGILLSDPETSRRHAALTSVEDFLTVRDLGSTNGTTVNGNPIQAETLLEPGDIVGVGDVRIVVIGLLTDDPTDSAPTDTNLPVGQVDTEELPSGGAAPAGPGAGGPGGAGPGPGGPGAAGPGAGSRGLGEPAAGGPGAGGPGTGGPGTGGPGTAGPGAGGRGQALGSARVGDPQPGSAGAGAGGAGSASAPIPRVGEPAPNVPAAGRAQVPTPPQPAVGSAAVGSASVSPAPASDGPPRPALGSAQVPVPVAGRAAVTPGPTPQPPQYDGAAAEGSAFQTGQPLLPLRPALEEMVAKETDAAVLRYRRGSAGEAAVSAYATAVKRARKRLAGLGSEPWGVKPQICLVDPFPDPDDPGSILTSGTVVDAARGEIFVVVTAESPPEPPERPLALFFGAALPAGRDVELLIEGYGLHLCGVPSADPYLAEIDEERGLPPLVRAEGELRTLMALSFVRFLLERGTEADLWKVFTTSRPGQVDLTVQEIYGTGLSGLEEQWLRSLEVEEDKVRITAFLRLAGRYLRPYIRREVEIGFYLLIELAFVAVFPFAFSRMINEVTQPNPNFDYILQLIGLLAGTFAISLLAELRRNYVSAFVSSSIVRALRMQMFAGLQSLTARWYNARKQGDILSRLLSDVGMLEQGLSNAVREGLFQSLTLIVSGIVLLQLNWILGLIVLTGAPIVAFIYRRLDGPALKRSKAVQENVGALVSVAAESYQAHAVVQAFGLENEERSRFGRASDRLFKRQLSLQLFSGLFDLSVDAVVTTLRLITLVVGSYLVIKGSLSVGDFAAAITQIATVVGPVTALTGIGQQIQTSTGALFRVNEILGAKPEIDDHPQATPLPPVRREIRLADISFSYDGDRPTLRGVDVTIKAGTKVAFVGPTGAGKSSTLQLIMRFYDPDRGAVLFDGRDIRGATLASLRGQLGVVFQETFLFDGTLRDNIGLGRLGASPEEIEKAARAAQLHEYITTLPRGYDTPVGERGVRLSGGQRQRLALARALLRDPAVLLLDEATSALDPRTERLVAETLESVSSGRTLIAVTHRLTSIVDYDQIYVLESGQIVEQGTHDELVALGGVYADLWAEQNGLPRPSETAGDDVVDPAGALAQVPFFAGLDDAELRIVAASLREIRLERGDTLPARTGQLAVVVRGQGRVFAPDPTGRAVQVAELGPGQVFGLGALLGDDTAAELRADRRMELGILTEQALYALATRLPAVAAALNARRSPSAPLGGERLSQVRMLPPELRRLPPAS